MDTACNCFDCNPMDRARTDSGMLDMGEELSRKVIARTGDAHVAESSRILFVACAALLRDWFKDIYFTLCGMETLLSLALMQGKYDTRVNFETRRTPLDLMFGQIENGVKYTRDEHGKFDWHKSLFVRKYDGACPGDMGGMPFGTDVAASFYAVWRRSAPPEVLEESVYSCINEVAGFGIERRKR